MEGLTNGINSLNVASTSKNSTNNKLRLIHQNIQGYRSKEYDIEMYVEQHPIELLCLTEHWLRCHELIFTMPNYTLASHFTRISMCRGGSLILIRNNIKFKERRDIVAMSVEHKIEIACIELDKYIIVCVYRPPFNETYSTFEIVMERVLGRISVDGKRIIVCGDFNVDLLQNSSMSSNIKTLFNSFNLQNVFLEPTRTTSTTATCIDNVFCNCEFDQKSILNTFRSDHSGQYVVFTEPEKLYKRIITCRPITSKQTNKFYVSLSSVIGNVEVENKDPNTLFNCFFNTVTEVFNSMFPLKTVKKNNKLEFSEWATLGIRTSRTKLFKLYEERSYNTDMSFKEYVKEYSKTFKRVCTQAKSMYLGEKIRSSTNKIKSVWKVIQRESGKSRPMETELRIQIDNKILSSNDEVAEVFEKYFSEIPTKVTESLNSSVEQAAVFMKENIAESNGEFKFDYIDPNTIIKTFKSLNVKNTEDLWGMSVKVIGSVIDILASPLAYMFNYCVSVGIFPDLMKFSKVVPLFKSGERMDIGNYRPVSILPIFSKIFEKIILAQMQSFFNTNKLLHPQQFGFTKGRNTTDAGVCLIREIFNAWENHMNAVGVFCDLSKAFDCVDHEILLMKLNHYGIKDLSLNMVRSYLEDRIQKVEINRVRSLGSRVRMGVPQGSILGPFLFLIYINDLPHMLDNKSKIVMFADDTSLIFKVSRQVGNIDEVNTTIKLITKWFTANNLLLNAKKTKCINFVPPNASRNVDKVVIEGEDIEFVNKTVFLGVTIDSSMNWSAHIDSLTGRLSSAAYAVWRIRHITDEATARLVYFSYFHSIMCYGILLWGRAASINSVFVLQKRAIRAIYKMRRGESLREHFKQTNILTVSSQYIYENIMYVRKNLSLFTKKGDTNSLNLRNNHKLAVSRFRLTKVNNSFVGNCVRFYNMIPENITNVTESRFKKIIKTILVSKAYYKVEDYLNDNRAWT